MRLFVFFIFLTFFYATESGVNIGKPVTYSSYVKYEKAVIERGDMNAASMLGKKGIELPLSQMTLHVNLCKQMWEIGYKQYSRSPLLAQTVLLQTEKLATTVLKNESTKLQKPAEEEVVIKEKRKQILADIQREEETEERRRFTEARRVEARKIGRETEFDTAESVSKKRSDAIQKAIERVRQAHINAEYRRKEEEKQKEKRRQWREERELTRRNIICQEELVRSSLLGQFDVFFEKALEERALHNGFEKNRALLLEQARTEMIFLLNKRSKLYRQYHDAIKELYAKWNYRNFFFSLSYLDTEEGYPFYELKLLARTFLNKHDEPIYKGLDFSDSLLNMSDPFLQYISRNVVLFKELPFLNSIQVYWFFVNKTYGLTRRTMPFPLIFGYWDVFFDEREKTRNEYFGAKVVKRLIAQKQNLNIQDIDANYDKIVTSKSIEVKKTKYNIVFCIFNENIDGLLKFMEEWAAKNDFKFIEEMINILTSLLFKGRHSVDKTAQYIAKFEDFVGAHEEFFAQHAVINPLMELMRAQELAVSFLRSRHPQALLNWAKGYTLGFLPEDADRDKVLQIQLTELRIYAWKKTMKHFYDVPEGPEKMASFWHVFQYLCPIINCFEVAQKVFSGMSKREQEAQYVLEFNKDLEVLFSFQAMFDMIRQEKTLESLPFDLLDPQIRAANKYLNINMLGSLLSGIVSRLNYQAKTADSSLGKSFNFIIQNFPMSIFSTFEEVEKRKGTSIEGWRKWKELFENEKSLLAVPIPRNFVNLCLKDVNRGGI